MTDITQNQPSEARAPQAADKRPQTDMETASIPPRRFDPPRSGRRFRPGAALAAFVLVIAAGITLVLLSQGSDSGPAAPVDIGRSFIEAQNDWDAEASIALLAPDAVITDGLVSQLEEYAGNLAWKRALDWQTTIEECSEVAGGPPAQVTCTYSFENAWTTALGVGPFDGSSYDFVIANEQIQEIDSTFDSSLFSVEAWGVFTGWVELNHPEGLNTILIIDNRTGDVPIVTPEAVTLWEEYTDEFVAEVTTSGTP